MSWCTSLSLIELNPIDGSVGQASALCPASPGLFFSHPGHEDAACAGTWSTLRHPPEPLHSDCPARDRWLEHRSPCLETAQRCHSAPAACFEHRHQGDLQRQAFRCLSPLAVLRRRQLPYPRYDEPSGNRWAMMSKLNDNLRCPIESWLPLGVALSMATLLIPVVARGTPADCSALRAAYRAAVPGAQVCDAKAPATCAAVRPAALGDACRCQVSVNPQHTQQLDRLLADYETQRCAAEKPLCNRMCTAPVSTCNGGATSAPALCGHPN